MQTRFSFSFAAKLVDTGERDYIGKPPNEFVTSAGRWDTLDQAVRKAAEWLIYMAGESPQQYCIEIVQVEELALIEDLILGD